MKGNNQKLFQAREFSELTGVTVRTLHHYDRLGLLKPSRYTGAGYRLYGDGDLARLEQIVALKFIGFSLKEIKDLLKRDSFDMSVALRRQREAIEEKRRRLELAIQAIQRAEYVIGTTREPGWETFIKIIEVINMQHDMDWSKKYYSEEVVRERTHPVCGTQASCLQIPMRMIYAGRDARGLHVKDACAPLFPNER